MEILIKALAGIGSLALIWKTISFFYSELNVSKILKGGSYEVGYFAGKKVKKEILDKIKDNELKAQILTDLDQSGDRFDEGWDDGLIGSEKKQ